MTASVALMVLVSAAAIVPQNDLILRRRGFTFSESIQVAQKGRDARDDGAAARSDALMGTPNKKTPVPQDNLFSTSPRLEQQPRATEPPAPRGATPAPPAPPR